MNINNYKMASEYGRIGDMVKNRPVVAGCNVVLGRPAMAEGGFDGLRGGVQ